MVKKQKDAKRLLQMCGDQEGDQQWKQKRAAAAVFLYTEQKEAEAAVRKKRDEAAEYHQQQLKKTASLQPQKKDGAAATAGKRRKAQLGNLQEGPAQAQAEGALWEQPLGMPWLVPGDAGHQQWPHLQPNRNNSRPQASSREALLYSQIGQTSCQKLVKT